MAPYLTTMTLGRFQVRRGTAGTIPTYVAVDPKLGQLGVGRTAQAPGRWSRSSRASTALPVRDVGAIVDDAPELGYSLETQTKPVFASSPDEATVLHELSHQWFGDAVTLRTWPDIWLHEGFATWSEWIWFEHTGGRRSPRSSRSSEHPRERHASGTRRPGDPGDAARLFDGTIYDRGGMTLQALREKIGDETFFSVLRRWYAQNKYGTVERRASSRSPTRKRDRTSASSSTSGSTPRASPRS